MASSTTPKYIFILGINARSGTNYLNNLIVLHPDCTQANMKGEDYLVHYSDDLVKYIDGVKSQIQRWDNSEEPLRGAIEQALLNYLSPSEVASFSHVVTKTPSPKNIQHFFKLFPDAYLVLLSRRGQDVAESWIRSFSTRFDEAVLRWLAGAKTFLDFEKQHSTILGKKALLVKYEDLFSDNKNQMETILSMCGLDPAKYNFDESENLGVVGSSTLRTGSDLSWKEKIKKDDNFDPTRRSQNWTKLQHYRFNWLAGKEAKALGYSIDHDRKGPIYYLYNFTKDIYEAFYIAARDFKNNFKQK